ncbi:MAG TPA: NAD(P)H-dependent oxidoreductase subunit E, partial [Bacteroidales bacterium]|nr:NAD(P)H-dependent oxidoreductase subunit E [Bacteroidales bacterium]
MGTTVQHIIEKFHKDPTRLMDILIDVQAEVGYIPDEAVIQISQELDISRVDVEQTISFYHFFSQKPTGKFNIYLNNSAVANMMGRAEIAATLEKEAGCKFGEVSQDGLIGLFDTSCIGMNDQEPAAIINGIIFTKLTPFRIKELVKDIKSGKSTNDLFVESYGDGMNNSELLQAMVYNNIRKKGPVLSDDYTPGIVIWKHLPTLSPEKVIEEIKSSNIRGRGGAGFPTGLKWEFCRKAPGEKKFIFCNADEGEPGTFKDRVLLTEYPDRLFEGMTIAGYAIGAQQGIMYLRAEYAYLAALLENTLEKRRKDGLLGKGVLGKKN